MAPEARVPVEVEGHLLTLSNLDKQLYPSGMTKGEVINYYTTVAPVLLPHVQGRPMTLRRWPNGTTGPSFFEKNAARNAPDWVRRATIATPGSSKDRDSISFVLVDNLATLVWLANLAALELHVPQWRVDADGSPLQPDRLVIDLDPGAGTTIVDCARVALLIREDLDAAGLTLVPKTSGSKGLQAYAPLDGSATWEDVHGFAKSLAERLERAHPQRIISAMEVARRRNKVLVDWSQNHRGKTTIAPYSLRGRPEPTASTPVTWDEVTTCAESGDPDTLRFLADDVMARVNTYGDLLADAL